MEHAHRIIRDRLYKYFTYKNTYRYIDVLPKFVKAYNDTVHSTTGIASSRVTDAFVHAKYRRMEINRQRVRVATVMFRVGQHVGINKEKMKCPKATEP